MRDEMTRMMKPLEEMDVIDDFLFTEIMSDEEDGAEVCRMILSLVLKREIGKISFTAQRIDRSGHIGKLPRDKAGCLHNRAPGRGRDRKARH